MSNYIDLVLCADEETGETFTYYAPAWSMLTNGDEVLVDSKGGYINLVVMNSITISKNSATYKFIEGAFEATGKKPFKKIVAKISYKYFEYETLEGINGELNNN